MADVCTHLGHVLDARKWAKNSQRKDWRLRKVEKVPGSQYHYRYTWHGPPKTRYFRICYGTKDSIGFLRALRAALEAYRVQLAHEWTDLDDDHLDAVIEHHGENFV